MSVKDQKQRDIIKNELNKNIFVEAGAGSGKTHSLVERMVSMVRSGIDVSKISAITFTKAAAVEFYNRFERMLSEAINSNIPENEKKLCEKALLNIDLCFMGTIDAFCNMVLSENPIEAGIPLNSIIVEEEEYKFLIKDEYNNILKNLTDPEDIEILKDFLRFQPNAKDVFTECMISLLSKRNYDVDSKDIKVIQAREKAFYDKYQDDIQKLIKGFSDDNGKYIFDDGGKGVHEAKEYFLENEWVIFKDWSTRPSAVITFLNKGLKKAYVSLDIQKMSKTFNDYFIEKKKYYLANEEKIDEVIKEFKSIQYDYTIAFINRFLDVVSNHLIQKGKLSFFDNLLLFRNLLKNDIEKGGELVKHITNRHEYYLIDEFQDTDPLQAEIMFYLTAEKPKVDFTLCKPKPGRLFIVGDPKQSIYRFRNADVTSYNFIKELFIKNNDLFVELTSNFRSHSKLIDYFNKQFKLTFYDLHDGLQAPFNSVDRVDNNKEKAILDGVYKYSTTPVDDPRMVGNLILNLKQKGYKYGDIMVLTYRKPKLKDYMEVFEEKSIPYEIEGQSVFDKCESFIKLRYLMGAIGNPDDSFYVYKALKKVLGISDSHIYKIFNDKGPSLIEKTNDPTIDRLVNFYNNNINNNVITVFDNILDEFDLIKYSSPLHLEYLYYAKELLREQVASGAVITFKEAYKYLIDLTEKGLIQRCLSLSNKDEDDRVLLANVHKVKGLQSKIVILTSNNSRTPRNIEEKVGVHSSFDNKHNYIIKIGNPNYFNTYYISTDDYKNESKLEGDALMCEEDRIAYVAATRAKDALFISSNSLNDDGRPKVPWGSLIKDDEVQSFIRQDDTLFEEVQLPQVSDVNISSLISQIKSFDSKCVDKTYSIKTPSKLINLQEDKDSLASKTNNNDASFKGTIIHRLLELYVSNKFADTIDTYLSVINNEYVLNGEHNNLLKEVFNTMKSGGYKQDPDKVVDLIRELKNAEEVYTELPFAYKEDNDIYNGIIDLLYKKDNKWFIVDYKTNLDPSELDKKYENQLEAYKKALEYQGIIADSYIYHIEIK